MKDFSLIGNQRNFIKKRAPLSIQEVCKMTLKQKGQRNKKKTRKNPTTTENPIKPSKNQLKNPQQYYITAMPSCFCPE
jgi:hypothetical protein